ncbi:glycosyltransferase [Brumimicrobium glaciale]|uniref:Glycosyltransferase n=1 Tax=Brumimicrobium glaciale TaxID=200475 RepID=A0A4Q4KNK8_9FLAO|nr:glycosyltransferase family 2 protein [Brumimicrobium glaciale]RYM34014.1 glycosyltransferase [Brumimicrobium glaciale]
MKHFILAITTFNRIEYLIECLNTWNRTKSNDVAWQLVIADDGSDDGTLEYLDQLEFENCEIIILKNNRIGVHQQMNTILSHLKNVDFNFCFKVDDDVTFLKSGWDHLYHDAALNLGNDHLVFCDEKWSTEQFLEKPILEKGSALIGRVPTMHAHGFFYTLSPQIIEKVGFMDVHSFGFRGMGHVDFTTRCARAGFTNEETPWDVVDSNAYISATKDEYHSVLPNTTTGVYDSFNRDKKEKVILQRNRIYVKNQDIDLDLYSKFKEELIIALSNKVTHFDNEKRELVTWYDSEMKKTSMWYSSQYKNLPNWYLKLGKVFKILKLK